MGLWGCGQRAVLSTNPSGRDRRAELSGPRSIDRLSVAAEARQAARPVEDRELSVRILVHQRLLEIAVGGFDRGDLGEPQLRWQAVLQGAEYPFHAAARLGRIGRNVGDAELRQSPADLGGF